MKLKFKNQQFQLDAVNAVVNCFKGQPKTISNYTIDKNETKLNRQVAMDDIKARTGFKNSEIKISPDDVLINIKKVQDENGLKLSPKLEGRYNLTIEMETGTGKTYTYIETMYELYNNYGWNKFIIVVPSIAIREGVYKSFQITEEHFAGKYGKKIRYFIYNSKKLNLLSNFATDAGINCMIINSQAFNARGEDARRLTKDLDEFNTRKPIDILAETRPIIIIDEPQSVEGAVTKEKLKEFNGLFTLRYSATHRKDAEYNKIYRLDAVDAYNKKIVKKISVVGLDVKGTTSTDSYIYFDHINIGKDHYPIASLEIEYKTKSSIIRKTISVQKGDNLYILSNQLDEYKNYIVQEIGYNTITFTNGVELNVSQIQGDINESHFRRLQIRETIKEHLEKEKVLFYKGIKVLSLFFIDEVSKYRAYDDNNNEILGEYGKMFVEEYLSLLPLYTTIDCPEYKNYLDSIDVKKTHNGYFSIDKKGKAINSKTSKNSDNSDDVDAYDLIMKDKERLLSFKEPTRFIFSHSALKEGWDNPNVFQICTLKHSNSSVRKRQEVGRGLRLCVNDKGERMDSSVHGIDVHDINNLTIIASESYETFAKGLQTEIAENLSDRPQKISIDFFENSVLKTEFGEELCISQDMASKLLVSFAMNQYIDQSTFKLTDKYFDDEKTGSIQVPEELKKYEKSLIELVKHIYDASKSSKIHNAKDNTARLIITDNYRKEEFVKLWNKINIKTAYEVDFDSNELIDKCIVALDSKLIVNKMTVTRTKGEIDEIKSKEDLIKGDSFSVKEKSYDKILYTVTTNIKYDLIGKIVNDTKLTRKTIAAILKGIKKSTFVLYQVNPEDLY